MADMNRGEWIALLKGQVTAAEAREDRWRSLGQELNVPNRDIWDAVAKLRRSEVEHLKMLLDEAQTGEQQRMPP